MSRLLKYSKTFLNSKFYPLLIFVSAFFAHTFSVEELGAGILITTTIIGLFICDDLKFLISPLFFFIFMISEKSVSSNRFFEKPYLIAMIVLGSMVFLSFLCHFIIHKKSVCLNDFKSSKLVFGMVILSVSFLLNGLFSSSGFHRENIIFPIALTVCLLGVLFIFSINLKKSPNLKNYIFYVLILVSILLTLQVFLAFINQIKIVNGQIVKESILFGWGMWNNMGGMLAFLLPVHFYFACSVRRFGFIFYFTGLISFAAII